MNNLVGGAHAQERYSRRASIESQAALVNSQPTSEIMFYVGVSACLVVTFVAVFFI